MSSTQSNRDNGGHDPSGNHFATYELAVEMADRISVRRGLANSFFLTANTAVVALLAAQQVRWYLPVAGLALSISWWMLLKSYRDLNKAKFEVILRMEEHLPVRLYASEWEQLRGGSRGRGQYRELWAIERIVPLIFATIYLAELLRQMLG